MKRILRGMHNAHDTMVGNRTKRIVHNACSDMLFNAILMVRTEDAHVRIRFKTNAVPTINASHLPPIILKQSTQLSTIGYLL
jgi:hypothetical protein